MSQERRQRGSENLFIGVSQHIPTVPLVLDNDESSEQIIDENYLAV